MAEHGRILAQQAWILANHDQRIDFQDQILLVQKEILRQLGQIQVGQHHALRVTYGMTITRNLRWHKGWVYVVDFERRCQQSFMETYHLLNLDGEEDNEKEEEERPAPWELAPIDWHPRQGEKQETFRKGNDGSRG